MHGEIRLRYLYEAARLGTMRAASEELNVATSSISRQIAALEKDLGMRLIEGGRRKIKLTDSQDCVILGWTPGQGGRGTSFGALLVGAIDADGEMRWIGQVGTGFTDTTLKAVLTQLEPLVRADPPIDDPELAAVKGATYVEPELVCEVVYLEITKSTKKMRAPSFKGMRPDKTPEECVLELRRG